MFGDTSTKPSIDQGNIFCTFRSSKAYLWGLVAKYLASLQGSSKRSLHILDAACHSLITRNIFPENSLYYGIDIALSRLQKSSSSLRDNDTLYLGDITKVIPPFVSCFDVLVSQNTFSHLPKPLRFTTLEYFISYISSGGSLVISLTIDDELHKYTSLLSSSFERLDSVYFDSIKSIREETYSNINASNIKEMILQNELSFPNNALFHRQVCIFAQGRVQTDTPARKPLRGKESFNIIKVNDIPSLSATNYPSDQALMSDSQLLENADICIFSKGFALDPRSSDLHDFFCIHKLKPIILSNDIPYVPPSSRILLIGFETHWSPDDCADRLFVNRLRSDSSISLNFILVANRFDIACTPSLLSRDF